MADVPPVSSEADVDVEGSAPTSRYHQHSRRLVSRSIDTSTSAGPVPPEPRPVVHFEIVGADPPALRDYYHQLFGWDYHLDAPVAPEVSDPHEYAFVDRTTTDDGTGIPGGIGGGPSRPTRAMFYVGVPDVEEALHQAEELGGVRVMGPARNDAGGVVVGHFTDPEGNLVGVAGPA